MAAQTNTEKTSKVKDLGKFFKYTKSELKKVIWPNKKELTSYTTIVIVTCAIFALGTWIVDSIFAKALQFIIK
ncbi:MAG TPA: preprotein translocase subunit SecE [Clostridiales bacterium]|nr:preprotein translocase subunit SecE [Clostridiales bacterium]